MPTTRDELFAATIRQQIAYLEGLLDQLESDPEQDKNIALKIREVESKLKELRGRL